MPIGSRIVNDEISGWLEDYLRPDLEQARRNFLWQYACIYDKWSQHHMLTEECQRCLSRSSLRRKHFLLP